MFFGGATLGPKPRLVLSQLPPPMCPARPPIPRLRFFLSLAVLDRPKLFLSFCSSSHHLITSQPTHQIPNMAPAMRLATSTLRASLKAPSFYNYTAFTAARCYSSKSQVQRDLHHSLHPDIIH